MSEDEADQVAPAPEEDRAAAPVVRVVRGHPSDTDLAALVAVLLAQASASSSHVPPARRSPWGDPASLVRGGSSSPGWGARSGAPPWPPAGTRQP